MEILGAGARSVEKRGKTKVQDDLEAFMWQLDQRAEGGGGGLGLAQGAPPP